MYKLQMESVFPKCLLFQPFKQSGEVIKPARVNFQIKQVAVSIEEFVGRKGVNAKIALDSCLLFIGQVIVSHIVAAYIILLDDVLP